MEKNVLIKNDIPLSLYVHLPWCKKKCPYCDFNSHEFKKEFPEQEYCEALIKDFLHVIPKIQDRSVETIFFGGGTPNLFSSESINFLISKIKNHINVPASAEVTLEANPHDSDKEGDHLLENLFSLKEAGVTRLSVGVQSFNDQQLMGLGRLYNGMQAHSFLSSARKTFSNINIDIMYGNPGQTVKQANEDLKTIVSSRVDHISLYQLTVEPNTFFYKNTPELPSEDQIWKMYLSNLNILQKHGYGRYEVSSFALKNKECKHNLNYWKFGDYVGIGAGAHSKLTFDNSIERHYCKKNPNEYLLALHSNNKGRTLTSTHRNIFKVKDSDLIFEFMLNGLRLVNGVNFDDFITRTGCPVDDLTERVNIGINSGLLEADQNGIKPSVKGLNFLSDLQLLFISKN